ncbi:MAG: hypothetical protein J2P16_13885 [Mycobacterium sp.]|nr:hypothetical protein [Mycobacterium sp.]
MEQPPVPAGDDAAAAERVKQTARNPLVPRDAPEALLAALNRLIDASVPEPAAPVSLNFSVTARVAVRLKHAVEQGLAERDAADRAEPRRVELPERVRAALSAVTDCIDGMRALERRKVEIETAAVQDGFIVDSDGSIDVAPQSMPSIDDDDEVHVHRARLEHEMMSTLADIVALQVNTVDTVRERLGADQPGTPWVVLECARGGHDLGPAFEAGAQLPASPLRDVMEQLAAAAAQAKAAVWPDPAR